jgi:hypothetical protein
MDTPLKRPCRPFFDTNAHAKHVTFDDGRSVRRNVPWAHFVEANWNHPQEDVIRIAIGEWIVVIEGHNLAPLFVAIEEGTLVRVRAQPTFLGKPQHLEDSFATAIRFLKMPTLATGRTKQLELGIESTTGK